MDRHDDLVVALTPLIDVLERLGVAWYVGGSVASTVHGRFRATNGVDVIANLRSEDMFWSCARETPPGCSSFRRHLRSGFPTMTSCSRDTSISPILLST